MVLTKTPQLASLPANERVQDDDVTNIVKNQHFIPSKFNRKNFTV